MNNSAAITVELVDGTKLIVPNSLENISSYVLREQGDWFEDEIKFLRHLVQPGDTVVDIGANYGVYALSLARKIGPSGQVWAFEPSSTTAELLRASSAANGTTWLQVMQQAVSDREGEAWLQTAGPSELNSLASRDAQGALAGPGESVAVTTLDHCLERFDWAGLDLLKIDAEGQEERIMIGGAKLFRELSPLVMFEVKAGAELHLELVERFAEMDYQCFRLIPGLNALAPFMVDQEVDGYLLNLFAAKPDRAAALAVAGWLLPEVNIAANAGDSLASGDWRQLLSPLPYARRLMAGWDRQPQHHDRQGTIQRALAAWTISQDVAQPLARRFAALMESQRLLQQQCQTGCSAARWASLARVACASGARSQAVQALQALLVEVEAGAELDPEEPFLCPHPDFEAVEPIGSTQAWLEAAGLFALEQLGSFSGFYSAGTAAPRLQRLQQLGYETEVIKRRIDLVKSRLEATQQAADSSARDWFRFLDLTDPLRCLDVGALVLGVEPDPWIRWAKQGCAEVIGFEPLQEECDQLNQMAQCTGLKIRCLPWALGDGFKHTFYQTNVPMTSSLFPPARATVDRFAALGELMHVVQTLPVQTHRLDDVPDSVTADFLKLDVQGAELMILENARECLKSVSVIQCEVEFVELYEGQPLMADVDRFLRSQGFCFLRFTYTSGRPFKPVERADQSVSGISQMLWADAVYVRDFRAVKDFTLRQLRAAAFILHEAYQAYDLVALLLSELDLRLGLDLTTCYLAALSLSNDAIRVTDRSGS